MRPPDRSGRENRSHPAMPLLISPHDPVPSSLTVDLGGILPAAVRGRTAAEVARLPIQAEGRSCELGSLFAVEVRGDPADESIECRGDFSHVHFLAAGMTCGRFTVLGDAGRHAGERMSGGRLRVSGSAGDWFAAEIAGGEATVAGDAGDGAAAALPGHGRGALGGLVIVGGRTGILAAARMRRGILAVAGDCGAGAAWELRAGTLLVGGRIGADAGVGMRRGSLVALGPCLPPVEGFRRGAVWSPGFLPLVLRRLDAAGFAPAGDAWQGPWQHWHGDVLTGRRGEILHRPEGL
jgi:formylmethanofuran dehydrogenase subunit C